MSQLSIFHPAYWLATWFYSGKSPKAPGTFGSVATIPFFFFYQSFNPPEYFVIVVSALLLIIGTWVSNIYMDALGKHDPSEIVIDEVLGQFITLVAGFWLFCHSECSMQHMAILTLACFSLFRIFDIVKPWPIGWFDKRLKGGFGVMFDDVVAALFAIICLWIANNL